MTVVRFKKGLNDVAAFNNLLSDVFPQMPSLYKDDFKSSVPANIRENENEVLIDLVAPGMTKENFGISLEDNLLTISAEVKEEDKKESEKVVRAEYKFSAFKRSFTINETINTDGINAQYVNGVLTVTLPKKEVKTVTKQITIN